jgi:hypothetical protein
MATSRQVATAAELTRRQNHTGGLHYVDPYRPPSPPPDAPPPSVPWWNTRSTTPHERTVIEAALAEQRVTEADGLLGGLTR